MDDKVRIIEIKRNVFEDNNLEAEKLRASLKRDGVFLLNLMSSPGSGKTSTLIQLIDRIKDKFKVSVMEADIDSDVDAVKIREATGIETIQLHTGGMCHLDAGMTEQGLRNLDLKDTDIVILENVGNLVCPAEFDTGSCANAMILSVPEGDDKPLKYPLMFSVCDLVIINKIDVLPYFDFDIGRCRRHISLRNPGARVIPICARTGEGVDELAGWLTDEVNNWKNK
ncbi:MAG: hydrogenase nickel incorporation protein HypB [Bacteroidales bacterium]|nr:hydrogenase nickel incorporation protein HypB [Bacteroidales bacterium]